jgi:hypothetical protein
MKTSWDIETEALRHIRNGNAHIARPMVEALLGSEYPRAHYIEGLMYWKGGHTVDQDIERAIACFRRQCEVTPCASPPRLILARALLDAGGDGHRREARDVLTSLAEGDNPPETAWAFAHYFATSTPPDFDAAAKWYRAAFFRGRPLALGQLALLHRSRSRYLHMAMCSVAMLAALPIALLRHGKQARNGF